MPTIVFGTGFEHQIVSIGTASGTGAPIWDAVSGSPAISTSIYRTGAASLNCNCTGTAKYLSRNLPASTRTIPTVIYVRFASLPASDTTVLLVDGGVELMGLGVGSDGKWFAIIGSTFQRSTTGPSLGEWYRLEAHFNSSANPWTISWRVGGTDQTQLTKANAAQDQTAIRIGVYASVTTNLYLDDFAYSVTGGDYPLGPVYVKGYMPTSDGTHSNPSNFLDAGNAAINPPSNPAYDQFDAVPLSSLTEYVTQTATGTGDYVEVNFADSSEGKDPLHVQVSCAMSADTATTDHAAYKVREGGTDSTIFDGDPSETTNIFRTLGLATKPSGGAWTESTFNAMTFRFGFSSDANPDPRCGGVIAEAIFSDVTVTPVSDTQPAYLKGLQALLDSQASFVRGLESLQSSLAAYLNGAEAVVDSQAAFLHGLEILSAVKSAFLRGFEAWSSQKSAYLYGFEPLVSSKSAFLDGLEALYNTAHAFTRGLEALSGSKPAYLEGVSGAEPLASAKAAYAKGLEALTSVLGAFLRGLEALSSSRAAFVLGLEALTLSKPGFVRGLEAPSSSLAAFLWGQEALAAAKAAFAAGREGASSAKPAYLNGGGGLASSKHAFLAGSAIGQPPPPASRIGLRSGTGTGVYY